MTSFAAIFKQEQQPQPTAQPAPQKGYAALFKKNPYHDGYGKFSRPEEGKNKKPKDGMKSDEDDKKKDDGKSKT